MALFSVTLTSTFSNFLFFQATDDVNSRVLNWQCIDFLFFVRVFMNAFMTFSPLNNYFQWSIQPGTTWSSNDHYLGMPPLPRIKPKVLNLLTVRVFPDVTKNVICG